MGLRFTYEVVRMDGSGYKLYHNQAKAEAYAHKLAAQYQEKIQITRTAKGFAPYVYYIYD